MPPRRISPMTSLFRMTADPTRAATPSTSTATAASGSNAAPATSVMSFFKISTPGLRLQHRRDAGAHHRGVVDLRGDGVVDVAALDEHVVQLLADRRVERNRARLVVRGAVRIDRDGGRSIRALAGLDHERRELDRREDGGALEDGESEATGHLGVVGVRENRVQHVVAARLPEAGAEVVEVHRLQRAEPADRNRGLLGEETFLRRGLVDLGPERTEISAGDLLLEEAEARVAALRVDGLVEDALRRLAERARLRVDDHRARLVDARLLEDVGVLLDIRGVRARSENEADVRRIGLVAFGRLRREERRHGVVDDRDLGSARALQKLLADELTDHAGRLDVLRPADELRVEVLGRLGRIREAPADLLDRGLRGEALDLGGERAVERLDVDLALRSGHRLVFLVLDLRRNRHDAAAEVRAAGIENRRLRTFRNLAVDAHVGRNHHQRRGLALEAFLHLEQKGPDHVLTVNLADGHKPVRFKEFFRCLHSPSVLSLK